MFLFEQNVTQNIRPKNGTTENPFLGPNLRPSQDYICRLVCVDALRFHPILIKCGEDNWIAEKLLFFGSNFLEG